MLQLKQKGFAHLLLILIVLIGIGLAIYLVQTKTNLFPKAQENYENLTISELTNKLLPQSQQLGAYSATLDNSAASDLKQIAVKRKSKLTELASSDPSSFLKETTLLGKENLLPAGINQDIEKQVEVKGVLKAVHGDDFETKKSGPIEYYLDQPQIQKSSNPVQKRDFYKLHFVNQPSPKSFGNNVTINGIALDSDLVVETGDSSGKTTNLRVESTTLNVTPISGEIKAAVFLVNFQNNTSQPTTKEAVKRLLLTDPNSVDNYFRQTSFNKVFVSGEVYGWFTLPVNSNVCDIYNWATKVDTIAANSGINLSPFQERIYVMDNTSCGYGGFGDIGSGYTNGNIYRSWIFYPNYVDIYKHELGHNFGVHHANRLECQNFLNPDYNTCNNIEYGENSDLMGDTFRGAQFNAPHKAALGWIPQTNIQEAILGVKQYSIYNSETATALPQLIKVPSPYFRTGPGNTADSFYLSYRQPIGFDNNLSTGTTKGVAVHLWDDMPGFQTKLIDLTSDFFYGTSDTSLSDGQEYSNQTARLKIKQISHDSSKVVVEVNRGSLPLGSITASPNPCTIPIGGTSCQATLQWETTNAVDVKVKNQGTGVILSTDTSGTRSIEVSGNTMYGLYEGSTILGSVLVYPASFPEAPRITLNVNCIQPNYRGNGVLLRWQDSYNPVSYAMLDTSPEWSSITGFKYVSSYTTQSTQRETVAPEGFLTYSSGAGGGGGEIPYSLQPDTTYYAWLSNDLGEGPATSFSIPKCVIPPSPSPSPSQIPSPSPSASPSPSPTVCKPRPNIGRSTAMTANGMAVTLTPGVNSNTPNNPISKIEFTSFANGTLTIGTNVYNSPVTHNVAPGTSSIPMLIKQVTYGQPTTIQMKVHDTCGPYSLFFGGGTGAAWPK